MARKKLTEEERRNIDRIREIKKKAKNRKPGPDDEVKVTNLKVLLFPFILFIALCFIRTVRAAVPLDVLIQKHLL